MDDHRRLGNRIFDGGSWCHYSSTGPACECPQPEHQRDSGWAEYCQAIANELHGNATDTFWAGTAYLLTQAVCQPFIVALSDSFGRRLLYMISLAFFVIGTLLCCLSQNFNELLAGRSIQGIGGGGILALGLVILTDIVPLRQRPVYLGVNQLSWALGAISGPLIGGLLVQHTTWRWIFYLNFPFCGIGFLTVPLVMRLHVKRAPLKERLLYVDWIGAFLFISSTCILLIGLTWGGSEYPWSSWRTLVPIIIGLAGIVATVMWERYGAPRPFLHLELFNSFSALAAYTGALLQGLLVGAFPQLLSESSGADWFFFGLDVLRALLYSILPRKCQALQPNHHRPCDDAAHRRIAPN